MTFQGLKFLTDENIDVEVVDFLRSLGADAFDIKEKGLFGMSDREILKIAFENQRVVISQDSDFGTLIFRDAMDVFGAFYLRPGHISPQIHIESLQAIIAAELEYVHPFILVAENNNGIVKIRLRQV